MMAVPSASPDPLELAHWEEAFFHPLADVRRIQSRLRDHAEDGRQRLRGIAGASYRDLLETADMISAMNKTTYVTEDTMSSTARLCNLKLVQNLQAQSDLFCRQHYVEGVARELRVAAQHKLLRQSLSRTALLLQAGGSLVPAAELLIVARLLSAEAVYQIDVEFSHRFVKNRLTSLRRAMLVELEERFMTPSLDVPQLVSDLSAYTLATSSTPADMLRYLLLTRSKTIHRLLDQSKEGLTGVKATLQLIVSTVGAVLSVFPQLIVEQLENFCAQPLIHRVEIRDLDQLGLLELQMWLPDAMKDFRPWFRHDSLERPGVTLQLKTWMAEAHQSVEEQLPSLLDQIPSIGLVIQAREDVLKSWSRLSRQLTRIEREKMGSMLSRCINHYIYKAITKTINKLDAIINTLIEAVMDTKTALSDESGSNLNDFWSFRVNLDDQNHTKSDLLKYRNKSEYPMDAVLLKYLAWMSEISALESTIKDIRPPKLAESDMDDSEDESEILNDPHQTDQDHKGHFETAMQSSLQKAGERARNDLVSVIGRIHQSSSRNFEKAVYLLRCVTRLSSDAECNISMHRSSQLPLFLSVPDLRPLYSVVCEDILTKTYSLSGARLFRAPLRTIRRQSILWEGSPPSPGHPSPATLTYMKVLSTRMVAIGLELWRSGLKRVFDELASMHLSHAWRHATSKRGWTAETRDESKMNDNIEPVERSSANGIDDSRKDTGLSAFELQRLQAFFDALLLGNVFGQVQDNASPASLLTSAVAESLEASGLDGPTISRLKRDAAEYWKRTHLLYALLS